MVEIVSHSLYATRKSANHTVLHSVTDQHGSGYPRLFAVFLRTTVFIHNLASHTLRNTDVTEKGCGHTAIIKLLPRNTIIERSGR